jgi:hypothetical protein
LNWSVQAFAVVRKQSLKDQALLHDRLSCGQFSMISLNALMDSVLRLNCQFTCGLGWIAPSSQKIRLFVLRCLEFRFIVRRELQSPATQKARPTYFLPAVAVALVAIDARRSPEVSIELKDPTRASPAPDVGQSAVPI